MKTEAVYQSFLNNRGKVNGSSSVASIRDRTLYINACSLQPPSAVKPHINAHAGPLTHKTQVTAYPVARFIDDECVVTWGSGYGSEFRFDSMIKWSNRNIESSARSFADKLNGDVSITKIQFCAYPALCKLYGPKSSLTLNELLEHTFYEGGATKVDYSRTGNKSFYPPADHRYLDVHNAIRRKTVQVLVRRAIEFAITDWCAAIVKYSNDVRTAVIKTAQALERIGAESRTAKLRAALDDPSVDPATKYKMGRTEILAVQEIVGPATSLRVIEPQDYTLFAPLSGPFHRSYYDSLGDVLLTPVCYANTRLPWMTVKLPSTPKDYTTAWEKSRPYLQKLLDVIDVQVEDPFGIPVSPETIDAISLFRPNAASTLFESAYDLKSMFSEEELLEIAQEFPEVAAHFGDIMLDRWNAI